MNHLDIEVEAMAAALRGAGAKVHLDPKAPDYVKRAFLRMIADCPDCAQALGLHHAKSN